MLYAPLTRLQAKQAAALWESKYNEDIENATAMANAATMVSGVAIFRLTECVARDILKGSSLSFGDGHATMANASHRSRLRFFWLAGWCRGIGGVCAAWLE